VTCGIFEPGIFKTNLLDEQAKKDRVELVWNKMSDELKAEYGEEYKQQCKFNLIHTNFIQFQSLNNGIKRCKWLEARTHLTSLMLMFISLLQDSLDSDTRVAGMRGWFGFR
jgi:hypothetical protein